MVDTPEFLRKIIDGIEKAQCPKCLKFYSPRGVLNHWLKCKGDHNKNNEAENMVKDKELEELKKDQEAKRNELKDEIIEEQKKGLEALSDGLNRDLTKMGDGLKNLIDGKGKGKTKDQDEDEDEDEGLDLDDGDGGDDKDDDLEVSGKELAVIGTIIGVLVAMILIITFLVKDEDKTKKESKTTPEKPDQTTK